MDKITSLALQAIVEGLHRSGAITDVSVAQIALQLRRAASDRYSRSLDIGGSRELSTLADEIAAIAE